MREVIATKCPVAADEVISEGDLVGTDANGDVVQFTAASGQMFQSYAESDADNTGGAAGAVKVRVTSGVEEIGLDNGVTPKPLQNAYVVTPTSVTNVPPGAGAAEKWVGVFIGASQKHADKWKVDFRPAWNKMRAAVP